MMDEFETIDEPGDVLVDDVPDSDVEVLDAPEVVDESTASDLDESNEEPYTEPEPVSEPVLNPRAQELLDNEAPRPATPFRIEIVGQYDENRFEREDWLAADLREFLLGYGCTSAVMENSMGETINLLGAPERPGV